MTNPTSDGGTTFKTLSGECPWKVRDAREFDLEKDLLTHQIVDAESPDHRVAATPTNPHQALQRQLS